jgi:hypothetical protein
MLWPVRIVWLLHSTSPRTLTQSPGRPCRFVRPGVDTVPAGIRTVHPSAWPDQTKQWSKAGTIPGRSSWPLMRLPCKVWEYNVTLGTSSFQHPTTPVSRNASSLHCRLAQRLPSLGTYSVESHCGNPVAGFTQSRRRQSRWYRPPTFLLCHCPGGPRSKAGPNSSQIRPQVDLGQCRDCCGTSPTMIKTRILLLIIIQ